MTDDWVSVSLPYVTGGASDAWAAEAAGRGGSGTQRLRMVSEVTPPRSVAEALETPAGEQVVVRRRVMLLDEKPVELTDSYYPVATNCA